jgi:hypothetical protein
MIESWPERIQQAQLQVNLAAAGKSVARIPYGAEQEDWGAKERPCLDCRVFKGELHVPGCDAEECPVCHEQLITCECAFDSMQ